MSHVTTPTGPPATAQTGYGSGQAPDGNGQAQQAADQAKEKAQEAKSKASDKVREQVDQRSTQAGEQVTGTASDLRSVGEQLREQGKDTPAKLAEQAAERTERLGGYLRESDADRILGDVEDFARRQPWAVVAGGIALGFAASRFIKASSSERYQARGPEPTRPQTTSPAPAPALVDGHPGATIPPR